MKQDKMSFVNHRIAPQYDKLVVQPQGRVVRAGNVVAAIPVAGYEIDFTVTVVRFLNAQIVTVLAKTKVRAIPAARVLAIASCRTCSSTLPTVVFIFYVSEHCFISPFYKFYSTYSNAVPNFRRIIPIIANATTPTTR